VNPVDFLMRQAEGLEIEARHELLARLMENLRTEHLHTEKQLDAAYRRSEAA